MTTILILAALAVLAGLATRAYIREIRKDGLGHNPPPPRLREADRAPTRWADPRHRLAA